MLKTKLRPKRKLGVAKKQVRNKVHKKQHKKVHNTIHQQKREFRGPILDNEAHAVLDNIYPESFTKPLKRAFELYRAEKVGKQRWEEMSKHHNGFSLDYAIEIADLLVEQLYEMRSIYHWKIYSSSQHAHDNDLNPLQHYIVSRQAQDEVISEILVYLDDHGLPPPWKPTEENPNAIQPYAETAPCFPTLSPHASIAWSEIRKLLHRSANRVVMNETEQDKAYAEQMRKLREKMNAHDMDFISYAWNIDDQTVIQHRIDIDTARRIITRFNQVYDQHNVSQQIENAVKQNTLPLGGWDEVMSWQNERQTEINRIVYPYFSKILSEEFKAKGRDAFLCTMHWIYVHQADPQVLKLLQDFADKNYYFYTPPNPDAPETLAAFAKEQSRRAKVLETRQNLAEAEEKQ